MDTTPSDFLTSGIPAGFSIYLDEDEEQIVEPGSTTILSTWGALHSIDVQHGNALYLPNSDDIGTWLNSIDLECQWGKYLHDAGIPVLSAKLVHLVSLTQSNIPAYITDSPNSFLDRGVTIIDTDNPDASTQNGSIFGDLIMDNWKSALRSLGDDCMRLAQANINLPEATHACVIYDEDRRVTDIRHLFFNITAHAEGFLPPVAVHRSLVEQANLAYDLAIYFIALVLEHEKTQYKICIDEELVDADEQAARIDAIIQDIGRALSEQVEGQLEEISHHQEIAQEEDLDVAVLGARMGELGMEEDDDDDIR